MNSQFCDESRPAWYDLSIRNDSILSVAVHRAAIEEEMRSVNWSEVQAVGHLMKTFGFSHFEKPDFSKNWGFDTVARWVPSQDPMWTTWEFQLPKIKTETGSGESPQGYMLALRSTLYLLTTCMWLFKGKTDAPFPQLVVIDGIILPESNDVSFGNGSLAASFTPDMVKWLAARYKHNDTIQPVIDAMAAADKFMWEPDSHRTLHGFRALFRQPKWVNLDIPGNACGLDPDNYNNLSLEEGYTLQPHNVDTGFQQLTFLMGLAKINSMARGM